MILLALKITFTIVLLACIATCIWLIVTEIKTYKEWHRLFFEVLFMVLGIVDIMIIWCR